MLDNTQTLETSLAIFFYLKNNLSYNLMDLYVLLNCTSIYLKKHESLTTKQMIPPGD
jgi:hypothetical protein